MAAFPGETFLQHIRGAYHWIAQEFEYLYSQLQGYLSAEHKDDGRHSDVNADTIATGKLSITSPDWFIRLFHSQAPKTKLLEWSSDKPATERRVLVDMASAPMLAVQFTLPTDQTHKSTVSFRNLTLVPELLNRGGQRAGVVFTGRAAAGQTAWVLGPTDGGGAYSSTNSDGLGVYDHVPGNTAQTKRVFGVTKDPMTLSGYLVSPNAYLSGNTPVYLGHRNLSGVWLWESVEGKLLYGLNGVQERGRTVAMGEWTTPAYSAANFSTLSGPYWTVEPGDVVTHRYTLIGKTMTVTLYLAPTSLSVVTLGLGVKIPAGYTAATTMFNACVLNTGSAILGYFQVVASDTWIYIYPAVGGNLPVGTNHIHLFGQITFEVL